MQPQLLFIHQAFEGSLNLFCTEEYPGTLCYKTFSRYRLQPWRLSSVRNEGSVAVCF